MDRGLKALIIIITVLFIFSIGSIAFYYHLYESSVAPTITIDSVKVSPGSYSEPWVIYQGNSKLNFMYKLVVNFTVNYETIVSAETEFPPCLYYISVTSTSWQTIPIDYSCPMGSTPFSLFGIKTYSIIGQIMANSKLLTFPYNLNITLQSGFFQTNSVPYTLKLSSDGSQYISLFKASTTRADQTVGIVSYLVNTSFYYMSDHTGPIITNCSKAFNLHFNSTYTWYYQTLGCQPSNSKKIVSGGTLFNLQTRVTDPGGSFDYNRGNLPLPLPLQIIYNQGEVKSNVYEYYYSQG